MGVPVIEEARHGNGVHCIRKPCRTGGPWSQTEQHMQINCLELLAAALYSSEMLCQRQGEYSYSWTIPQSSLTYLLNKLVWRDNLQGTKPSNKRVMAVVLRQEHNSPSYPPIAGIQNTIADEESHAMKDWMLCPQVFNKINLLMGPYICVTSDPSTVQ